MPKPLPYPAHEIRCNACDMLENFENDLRRLIIFWRGNDLDAKPLERIQAQAMTMRVALEQLEYPLTRAHADFDNPAEPRPGQPPA